MGVLDLGHWNGRSYPLEWDRVSKVAQAIILVVGSEALLGYSPQKFRQSRRKKEKKENHHTRKIES